MVVQSGDLIEDTINTSTAVNANWLTADVGPFKRTRTVRITVWMDAGGILNLQMKNAGTTVVEQLNEAVALVADCRYVFDVDLGPNDSFNVQHSTGGTQNISIRAIDVPRL